MKRGTPNHPKTVALAAALGVDRCVAVGLLEGLWHFAGAYARRGDVGRHSDSHIAAGLGTSIDPEVLVKALLDSGWLDACKCHRLRIHDWPEHADVAVQKTNEVKTRGFLGCYASDISTDASGTSPAREPAGVNLPPAQGTGQTADGTGNGADGGHAAVMLEKQRKDYAEAVRAEFYRLAGLPETRLLSPAEFDMLKYWMDEKVPLRVVLRGMADTRGKGRTLNYYGPSVWQAFKHWNQSIASTA